MKNFLIQHLSTASNKTSAGILGCLADGIDVQYECWEGKTVKALSPDKVQFLRFLINSLIGSVTFKCDYAEEKICRESVVYPNSYPSARFIIFLSTNLDSDLNFQILKRITCWRARIKILEPCTHSEKSVPNEIRGPTFS